MTARLRAAATYAALAFAAGFVLGVIRTLVVEPQIGRVGAVVTEAPVMLAISWAACTWTMRRYAVPPRAGDRVIVGVCAFLVLLALELALAMVLGRSPADIAASYASAAGRIGMAAQAVFALLPLGQLLVTPRDPHR